MSASARLFRKHRAVALTAIFLAMVGLIIGGVYLNARVSLQVAREQLMNDPRPLPSWLSATAPYPGTHAPDDDFSGVYWTRMPVAGGSVCIRVDARIFNSNVTWSDEDLLWKYVPPDHIHLLLNGQPPYRVGRGFPGEDKKQITIFPELYTESDSLLPPNTDLEGFHAHVPIIYCWEVNLPPGSYLAELTVETATQAKLTYAWAFEITHPSPDSCLFC